MIIIKCIEYSFKAFQVLRNSYATSNNVVYLFHELIFMFYRVRDNSLVRNSKGLNYTMIIFNLRYYLKEFY